MADPILDGLGERMNFSTGEQAKKADFNDVGDMGIKSLANWLAWFYRDSAANAPVSGLFGDAGLVSIASGLNMSVAKGIGFYYDSANSDAFAPDFVPICITAADTTITLGAHDATLPRIDLIWVKPALVTDQAQSRRVKDLVLLTAGNTSVDKRARYTYEIGSTAGTPGATPAVPATPAGAIVLARAAVPAVSGAVVLTDVRPMSTPGEAHASDPRADYTSGFITSEGGALSVSGTGGLGLACTNGSAVMAGSKGVKRRRFIATTLTASAADATLKRRDYVVADGADNTIKIVVGTPGGGNPALPTLTADQMALAHYTVAAAAVVISELTLDGQTKPFGAAQIQAGSITVTELAAGAVTNVKVADNAIDTAEIVALAVTEAKIAGNAVTATKQARIAVVAIPVLTPEGSGVTPRLVGIQIKDADGVNIAETVRCIARVYNNTMLGGGGTSVINMGATGTSIAGGGFTRYFDTNSSGTAELSIATAASTGTYYVEVDIVGRPGVPATCTITVV